MRRKPFEKRQHQFSFQPLLGTLLYTVLLKGDDACTLAVWLEWDCMWWFVMTEMIILIAVPMFEASVLPLKGTGEKEMKRRQTVTITGNGVDTDGFEQPQKHQQEEETLSPVLTSAQYKYTKTDSDWQQPAKDNRNRQRLYKLRGKMHSTPRQQSVHKCCPGTEDVFQNGIFSSAFST